MWLLTERFVFQSAGGEHSFYVQPLSLPHCPKGLEEKQLNGGILMNHRLSHHVMFCDDTEHRSYAMHLAWLNIEPLV